MTKERVLELAYEALLMKWDRQKQRQKKGIEEGYETPSADYWEAVFSAELTEISRIQHGKSEMD